ncbi:MULTISPECIES: hypothetical protein [Leuconostoc gelidum group]|uniref:Uncharacterized protein n=1 Tax=Leuconostoc gelidum subsp. gelidum TaxID=1607839 RepID=A0AB35G1Y0_LEUGE|nr:MULTISPECIES: hypothetical protein [Leuconostoc gelidum group]MBZ5960314.1 hypothetical protein [Leuconostoc gasicomitatum]MBZ5968819.1 hypothetical protein [Leuconostoc gasicomitatum]MBZ6010457.1 hypothetical protein [Leuconostoc gelidum subsp. aenigmaticum]MBZ6016784.1 hypothetical protein [Leuconostoc gelidum subsp. gelidum]
MLYIGGSDVVSQEFFADSGDIATEKIVDNVWTAVNNMLWPWQIWEQV